MKILLSNDDGYESPALVPTINALEQIGDVTTVVPLQNQSWTSKSNTRSLIKIPKQTFEIEGKQVITIDGLPADCSNYGLYLSDKPDLLVTGANLGHNVGLSAYLASGTVGAALEGLIAGVPAISVSVPYYPGSKLVADDFIPSVSILPKIIECYMDDQNSMAMIMLNLPFGITIEGLVAATMDLWSFGQLFEDGDNFVMPKNYPDLNQISPTLPFTDTWCRKNKFGSIIALDKKAQIINRDIVNEWLIKHNLFDHRQNEIIPS